MSQIGSQTDICTATEHACFTLYSYRKSGPNLRITAACLGARLADRLQALEFAQRDAKLLENLFLRSHQGIDHQRAEWQGVVKHFNRVGDATTQKVFNKTSGNCRGVRPCSSLTEGLLGLFETAGAETHRKICTTRKSFLSRRCV